MAQRVIGRWRIIEMDLWDRDAFELLGPAFIEIDAKSTGRFRFIAVEGDIGWKSPDGRQRAEFTWEGNDEGDPASGRGWVEAVEDGSLRGRVFFHMGDDAGFRAVADDTPHCRRRA